VSAHFAPKDRTPPYPCPRSVASRAVLLAWHAVHSPCLLAASSLPPFHRGTMWSTSVASTYLPCCSHETHNGLALSVAALALRHGRPRGAIVLIVPDLTRDIGDADTRGLSVGIGMRQSPASGQPAGQPTGEEGGDSARKQKARRR
jgi:hypothetical protein